MSTQEPPAVGQAVLALVGVCIVAALMVHTLFGPGSPLSADVSGRMGVWAAVLTYLPPVLAIAGGVLVALLSAGDGR